jgi:signal transduction histidine kinase
LRPTVLDDLGLIPALHSHLKSFTATTGIHVHLTVFAAVEKLSIEKRTTLFRVAQEALTNAARHSKAANVEVVIQRAGNTVTMQIKDDGNSFDAKETMDRNRGKRLGLVGMKERVEIMGGAFGIESSPGHGCTITAQLSSRNASPKRPRNS